MHIMRRIHSGAAPQSVSGDHQQEPISCRDEGRGSMAEFILAIHQDKLAHKL